MALTRREFLAGGLSLSLGVSLGLSSFSTASGASLHNVGGAQGGSKNRVLVVVNLSGGNDAFNTVVPWSNRAYHRARPNLALGEGEILKLDDELALAAPLQPLFKYFEAGNLALMPGVGLSSGLSRSHSRATAIWHSAQPDVLGQSGWIGRYLDVAQGAAAFDFEPEGEHRLLFTGLKQNTQNLLNTPNLDNAPCRAYPQTRFGQSLAAVARTVAGAANFEGGAQSSIFSLSLAGFDTHSNQKSRQAKLLGELACGLDAFMADVNKINRASKTEQSVVVLVQSEFGRRLKENSGNIFSNEDLVWSTAAPDMVPGRINGNVGTDHGSSGLCLVLGNDVRGGIYGQYGDLSNLVDGEVAASLDFRTVYATILEGHLKTDSKAILGADFERLGFV